MVKEQWCDITDGRSDGQTDGQTGDDNIPALSSKSAGLNINGRIKRDKDNTV